MACAGWVTEMVGVVGELVCQMVGGPKTRLRLAAGSFVLTLALSCIAGNFAFEVVSIRDVVAMCVILGDSGGRPRALVGKWSQMEGGP